MKLEQQFDEKSSDGQTSAEEVKRFYVQITVTKSLLQEKERLLKKKKTLDPDQTPIAPRPINLHQEKKTFTTAIFSNAKKELKADQFDANGQEIIIDEYDANGEFIGKSKQTNQWETVEEPIKKMEVDLDFRSQVLRDYHKNWYEMLQALDHSTVEDLISYKMKEDKDNNLLTLDDLRFQHLKFANELKLLQEQIPSADEFTNVHGVKQEAKLYESLIGKSGTKGDFSASYQNRNLTQKEQKDVNQKLASRASKQKVPQAFRNLLANTAQNQVNDDIQKQLQAKLKAGIKIQIETKPQPETFKSKLGKSFQISILKKQREAKPSVEKEIARQTNTLQNPQLTLQAPFAVLPQPSSRATTPVKANNIVSMFQKVIKSKYLNDIDKEFRQNDELDKWAKGYARQVTYNNEMSVVVLNFGCKLYNMQNYDEIISLLGKQIKKVPKKVKWVKIDDHLRKQLDEIWEEYDKDNSGSLDKSEALRFVKNTLTEFYDDDDFSDRDFEDCFNEFDQDGNGTIEKHEMAVFIKRMKRKINKGLPDDDDSDQPKQEKNYFKKVIPFLIDQKFEHTEFQLLRRMFGDDETYTSFNCPTKNESWGAGIATANDNASQLHDIQFKQQQIDKRVKQMQEIQYKYELDYAKSVTQQENKVKRFEFNSKDFYPDGTYMYYGDGSKFANKIKQKFNAFAYKYKDLQALVKPNVGQKCQGILTKIKTFMKHLAFGDQQEGELEEAEPVVTSMLTTVGMAADTDRAERKIDVQMLEIQQDQINDEKLRKQRIKDQMNRKQRGLDFVKLNKSVVYSNVNQLKLSRPQSSGNSPTARDLVTSQSRRLQIVTDQQKFQTIYDCGLKSKPFLSPGQQDSSLNLIESLQVLSSARKDYKQYNSVDEQLKLKYAQATDVDFFPPHDPVDEYVRMQLHSRRIVNSKKLTKVYVSGKRFTSKQYVNSLPYSRNMMIVNPQELWDGNQNKLIGSILPSVKKSQNQSINSSLDVKTWRKLQSKNFMSTQQSDQSEAQTNKKVNEKEKVNQQSAEYETKKFSRDPRLAGRYRRSNLNNTSDALMQSLNEIDDKHLHRVSIIDYAAEPHQSKGQTQIKTEEKTKTDEEDKPDDSDFDEEDDPDYFLTAHELKRTNEKLRMDLELQVETFQQYLKVAMLQTEYDHFKMIRCEQIKLKKDQENEQTVEQYLDPQFDFTIAKLTNDEDSKPQQGFSLPQNLQINAQNTAQSQVFKTESSRDSKKSQKSTIELKVSKMSKFKQVKPKKISKDLWEKITSVKDDYSERIETADLILNTDEDSKADQTNNTDCMLVDKSSMHPDQERHSRSDSKLQSRRISQNILEHPNESSSDHSERPLIAVGELKDGKPRLNTVATARGDGFHISSQREIFSADVNSPRGIIHAEQTKHLNYFIGPTEDTIFNHPRKDSLASSICPQPLPFAIPSQSNRRNLNDILKGTNKNFEYYESKLIKELTNLELPFTRLEAKPQALKDNLKAVLKYPMIKKPQDLDKKPKQFNFKKLVKRTFKEVEKHEVHVVWINKIQKLWKDLDSNYQYQKYLEMFDQLILKKKRLGEIKEENKYQSKVLKKKVKRVVIQHKNFNVKLQHIDKGQKRQLNENQAQITNLEDQVREALNAQHENDCYDLRNEVVKLRIEARLVEHIIFQAQKLTLKSDARMNRDLERLKEQGAVVAQDIFEYLQKRDKYKWRGWQESGDPRILEIIRAGMRQNNGGDSDQLTLEKMDQLLLKLINEVNLIEDKLDDVERDGNIHQILNKEMKKFVSQVLGHKGWIIHSTSKSNRKAKQKSPFVTRPSQKFIKVESMKSAETIEPIDIVTVPKQIFVQKFADVADLTKQAEGPGQHQKKEFENRPRNTTQSSTKSANQIIVETQTQDRPLITVESFKEENKLKRPAGSVSGSVKKVITDKDWVIEKPEDETTEKVQTGIFKAALEEAERQEIKKTEEYKHFSDINKIVTKNYSLQLIKQDNEDQNQELEPVRKKSKWIEKLVEEEQQRNERSKSFKQRKKNNLRQLYEEQDHDESSEDENIATILDKNAALNRIDNHLDHVQQHLKAENKLLSQWANEDQKEQRIVQAQLMQRVQPKRGAKRALTIQEKNLYQY